jgi:hypothetical protein
VATGNSDHFRHAVDLRGNPDFSFRNEGRGKKPWCPADVVVLAFPPFGGFYPAGRKNMVHDLSITFIRGLAATQIIIYSVERENE